MDDDIRDITEFADPYTEVKQKKTRNGVEVELMRMARPLKLIIREDGSVAEAVGRKEVFPSINALIASDRFANLHELIETQIRSDSAAVGAKAILKPIPTKISVDGVINEESFISKLISAPKENDKVNIILVDAPAGVGKTYQIQRVVREHAIKRRSGDFVPPVLHVTSKGRRLSNLRDVLSAVTQDLNTRFHARHVPLLLRRGLIAVAVDGFDELVDADGYEDSWLALKNFVDDVGRSGTIVLAARDTFIDEQELLSRIERTKNDIRLTMISVLPPSSTCAKEWLNVVGSWKAAELESEEVSDLLREGGYALRPFFLRELATVKGTSSAVVEGHRQFLIDRLLKRESGLLAQQVGGTTAEEIHGALYTLMEETAIEMATRELDYTEVEHVSFLTQILFDGLVDPMAIRKVMHKSGSLSLLELTSTKGARQFPHSEIRGYFLGSGIIRLLAEGTIPNFLRRYTLNSEELEVMFEVIEFSNYDITAAANFANSMLASEVSSDALLPNLSSMAIAFMAAGYLPAVQYVDALEATVAGMSVQGSLESSRIGRFDVCGSDISELAFNNVEITTLLVDEATVIGASVPVARAIEIRGSGRVVEVVRGRQESEAWLRRRSRLDAADEHPAVRLMEKIARRSLRQFYLRASGGDDSGGILLEDPSWPALYKVLARHDRVVVHRTKAMHGRPSNLIRVKNPAALIDRENRETLKIIDELSAN
ncbi:hypothetical protein JY420_16190 [Stenotrophomonas maltophilia]|nr:hypothetical protein [Stenotrophomonas maltophilia]MBN5135707.1 hypothetical protein [Stenotrophomonas maltophilia]UWU57388.1 ATP-binding protein [Stenotrophomonas maltophilia]